MTRLDGKESWPRNSFILTKDLTDTIHSRQFNDNGNNRQADGE